MQPILAFRIPNYDQQLADQICYRIAAGETLASILQEPNMPTMTSIWTWIRDRPAFALAYNQAQREQMRSWANEIIHLADDSTEDWIKATGKRGQPIKPTLNREHIERTKVRIQARQWLMARFAPEQFSEAVARGEGTTSGGAQALLGGASAKELVQQMIHLLAQFDVTIPPDKLRAMLDAIDHASTTGYGLKTLPASDT